MLCPEIVTGTLSGCLENLYSVFAASLIFSHGAVGNVLFE
jgi:hypothetical protein